MLIHINTYIFHFPAKKNIQNKVRSELTTTSSNRKRAWNMIHWYPSENERSFVSTSKVKEEPNSGPKLKMRKPVSAPRYSRAATSQTPHEDEKLTHAGNLFSHSISFFFFFTMAYNWVKHAYTNPPPSRSHKSWTKGPCLSSASSNYHHRQVGAAEHVRRTRR